MGDVDTNQVREAESLSRVDCVQLLASATVGRVIMTAHALPVALPVSYALSGEDVVFRAGEGVKLDAAIAGTVVAFEVDHIDPHLQMGWSVLVTGLAHVVTDPDELVELDRLGVPTWLHPTQERYVRITSGSVTGRRVAPAPYGAPAPCGAGPQPARQPASDAASPASPADRTRSS